MAYDFSSVLSVITSTLRIPTEWFSFPAILTNLIIPFILVAFAFYKLLEKIKIFREHGTIDLILAIVFALVLIPIGPLAAIAAAGFIGVVGLQSWKSRIIFVLILIFAYFVAIPFLSTIRF